MRVPAFSAFANRAPYNKIRKDGGGIGSLSRKCQIPINQNFCSSWIYSFIHSTSYIEQLLRTIAQGTVNIAMMKIEDLVLWKLSSSMGNRNNKEQIKYYISDGAMEKKHREVLTPG